MTKKEVKSSVSEKINNKLPIRRSKYNVNGEISSRTYKGITYDSAVEMRYFMDIVEPMYEMGLIKYYDRQKRYLLQEGFRRNGEYIRPIEYIADYYIEYSNGIIEVIDIKGDPDDVSKLKRKLFWNKYPEINYKWITFNKKHGGWMDYDQLHKLLVVEKREKKKAKAAEENKE